MNDVMEIVNEQEVLGKSFRFYNSIEEPLFLAKDVAEWIEYSVSNVSKMLNSVDDDEKTTRKISTNGTNYQTEAWFLTENGLYEVLMQSRKPIAKQFKKEVKKILKQIRQTGGYIPVAANSQWSDDQIMAQAVLIAQRTIDLKNKELAAAQQEIAQKDTKIGEMTPKAVFYDNMNRDTETTYTATSIAKLFGMTAQAFNKILNTEGVQYKSDGHWVLYSKWDNKGLVIYVPVPYKRRDGSTGTKLNMMFTSHGLVWLVNSLAKRNIVPNDMSQIPDVSVDVKTF